MSKKISAIVAVFLVVVMLAALVVPNNAIEINRFYGDIDNDGYVTTDDARIALLVAAGIYENELRGIDFAAADIDEDADVSTQDARTILKIAAGQIRETVMVGYEFSENPEDFADAVNKYRYELDHDVASFTLSPELCTAARVAAQEYALKTGTAFLREDGSYFYKLLDDMNISYTMADKIIIHSSPDYELAVQDILNDPQAEKAITSNNFSNIGVGAYSSDGRTFYWCIFLTK